MAPAVDGSYGVPEGLDLLVPVPLRAAARWEIVQGLEINDFSRARIDASVAELAEERDAVQGTRPGLSPLRRRISASQARI